MNTRARLALLGFLTGLALGLVPKDSEACGGLFCGNIPVNQTEEAIIFDVDIPNNTVTAIINILYQGNADEFAWLLPLQTNPAFIGVGSRTAFQVAQNLTVPRFQITEIEDVGVCSESYMDPRFAYEDGSGAECGGGLCGVPQASGGGVDVLQRQEVGPYDTVVLSGTDPELIRQWLVDNDFRVTDDMMEMVVPYVTKGDVILALKLLNNVDVGEIAPIEVTMSAPREERELDACVPIILTSIAADPDMPITTYLFSDQGRAIPQNFFHVEPNLLKIDWLNGGRNYRQLIADAVDEAEAGHAFTTEYAGSPDIFEDQVFVDGRYDLAALRRLTDLGAFLQELSDQGLLRAQGVRPILEKHFAAVAQCPQCSTSEFRGQTIDPNAVVDEIDEKVVAPDRRAQELMTRRAHFTRLLTMLDPEEMTVDPVFTYDAALPDVSNAHNAKMIRDCGVGGAPGSAGIQIVLEDGRVIYYESNGDPDRSLLDAMPAAAKIEQLAQKTLVRDNGATIQEQLDEHNSRNGAGGCGCSASNRKRGVQSGLSAAALLGLAFLARRRRSR